MGYSDDAAPDGACVTTGFGATNMSRRWRSDNSSIMKPGTKFAIVLVTAPDLKTARALAKSALSGALDRLREPHPQNRIALLVAGKD